MTNTPLTISSRLRAPMPRCRAGYWRAMASLVKRRASEWETKFS
jgi:hypothetical protein